MRTKPEKSEAPTAATVEASMQTPNSDEGNQPMNGTTVMSPKVTPPASPDFTADREAAARVPAEFNFDSHPVRVVQRDGQAWFVAVDVCAALNMARTQTRRLDDDEKGVHSMHTPSGEQSMTVINESGLYALVLRSRKPEARKFAKWVTSEVLPSIRKTGSYTRQEYSVDPTQKLTGQEAETLRLMLTKAAERVPKPQQGKLIMQGWSKLKSHFHCSYRDIPRHEFTEAVSILSRHAAEWEVVDALPAPAPMVDAARIAEAMRISGQLAEQARQAMFEQLITAAPIDPDRPIDRWVVSTRFDKKIEVRPVSWNAVIGSPEELAKVISEGGWVNSHVAVVGKAALDVLSKRLGK